MSIFLKFVKTLYIYIIWYFINKEITLLKNKYVFPFSDTIELVNSNFRLIYYFNKFLSIIIIIWQF